MTCEEIAADGLALEMRTAFDTSFAEPVQEGAAQRQPVMQIRVGTRMFAVRVLDTLGIARAGRIIAFPTRIREMLGLAGIDGNLVPVFDLAALLNVTGTGNPAFVLLVGCDVPVGLAFDALETTLQVALNEPGGPAAGRHIRAVVPLGSVMRPLIDIAGIRTTIKRLSSMTEPPEE